MPIIGATCRPLLPERFGVVERLIGIYGGGWRQVRRTVGEDKRHPFAARNGEIGSGRKVLSFQLDRCSQRDKVWAGDRGDSILIGQTFDPRHSRAIVEAEREVHPNLRASRSSLDNADDRGVGPVRRHEIDNGKGPVPNCKNSLQYHCVATIGPRTLVQRVRRRNRPPTVV